MPGGQSPAPNSQSQGDTTELGVMCKAPVPPPTPAGEKNRDQQAFETALNQLRAAATNFGYRNIQDAKVRQKYIQQAELLASSIRDEVQSGRMTYREGAANATKMRNDLMAAARLRTSDFRRAQAERLKLTGKSLEELQRSYATKLFNRSFDTLDEAKRNRVWFEIVESSGRTRPTVNASIARWTKLGRSFIFFSAAVTVYNITTAEDKPRAVAKEATVTGAGILGGMAGGAMVGSAGGPVGIAIGVFVGGAMAAFSADWAFDSLW